jgi:hypothetical protein
LTGDYRYPLVHTTSTHAFDVVVIALATLGVAVALRRRRWAVGLLGIVASLALYYAVHHAVPWVQFKAFSITATIALMLAFAGAAALYEARKAPLKWLGWLAAAVVAGAVLYGNAVIYHDTSLAPAGRYDQLAAIGRRYAGQGPAVFPYFDEYSEYFLRNAGGTDLVAPYGTVRLAPGVVPPQNGVSFSWDLNQISPAFLQTYPLIITARSPVASRPPSNYDLVQQTHYFDVWRRDRPTASVIDHFPLSSSPSEPNRGHFCRSFVADVRQAGPAAEIAYAQPSPAVVTGVTLGTHPDYWRATGPETVLASGQGRARFRIQLPLSARYDVWMQGSVGRPLAFYLDGRRLTDVGYEERYPNQFLLLGEITLARGMHIMRVVRGNGTLHPGSGDPPTDTVGRTVGAIVFTPEDSSADPVYVANASAAPLICAAPVGYQWLEILKAGGAPPDAIRVRG